MQYDRPRTNPAWSLAACTMAVAAAVSGSAQAAQDPSDLAQIQRYCVASWQNAGIARQEWEDCTQQALAELMERITPARLSEAIRNSESAERRELNRSVWRTVQRRRRAPRWVSYCESSSAPQRAGDRDDGAWEEVEAASRQCLTERQQSILNLCRDGWKIHEIAEALKLTAARVSDEKYKAIQRLRRQLAKAATLSPSDS